MLSHRGLGGQGQPGGASFPLLKRHDRNKNMMSGLAGTTNTKWCVRTGQHTGSSNVPVREQDPSPHFSNIVIIYNDTNTVSLFMREEKSVQSLR